MNIAEAICGDFVPPFKMIVKTAWEQYRFRSFWIKEPETIEWIRSFKDGDCFYDVGANIGMYSLYAASLYSQSTIVAIEPQMTNYIRLLQNREMNGFRLLFPLLGGISDTTGMSMFRIASGEAGSSGGQLGEVGYLIHTHSLDEFASTFGAYPNHIKIDIDGQEFKVISGMKALIADRVFRSCLIEIGKAGDEAQAIRQAFLCNGYTTDNAFNSLPNHSRNAPWRKSDNGVENIIFTRLP